MAAPQKIRVRVVSQKGTCVEGLKVGDQWVIDGKTPEGICISAFNSLLPSLRLLRFGGSYPSSPSTADPDVVILACEDPINPVVFELRRLRE